MCVCTCVQGLHLPGECVLVEVQLEMADALLQIADERVREERKERQQEQQKSCIEQVAQYLWEIENRSAHRLCVGVDD